MKQLTNVTRDLEESLIVNDLFEEKITNLNYELKKMKNEIKADETELKEQMRIQGDRFRINNIQEDEKIVEDENESWADT